MIETEPGFGSVLEANNVEGVRARLAWRDRVGTGRQAAREEGVHAWEPSLSSDLRARSDLTLKELLLPALAGGALWAFAILGVLELLRAIGEITGWKG